MVAVRPIREGEVETVVEELWIPFAKELAGQEGYDPPADGMASAVRARRDRIDSEDAVTLVAVPDGSDETAPDPVGFVAGEYAETSPIAAGPEVTIDELYVVPQRRREGIGSALLAAIEEWGNRRDCDVTRAAVGEENDAGRALYRDRRYSETRAGMVMVLR